MSDDSDINRYERWYKLGSSIEFYLSSYTPNDQESRFLLLKVVEQAMNDYANLEGSEIPYADLLWQSARDFIFDDKYWIYWGDMEFSLEDILDILEINLNWVRRTAEKKYQKRKNDKAIRSETETT